MVVYDGLDVVEAAAPAPRAAGGGALRHGNVGEDLVVVAGHRHVRRGGEVIRALRAVRVRRDHLPLRVEAGR